jgi:D-tyrosyl-tRNA(Tyr) deacylase
MNEVRYYLGFILDSMAENFVPQYIVTAVKLPTGAIEIAVNDKNIKEKIEYILNAYDDDMKLKTNPVIELVNLLVV